MHMCTHLQHRTSTAPTSSWIRHHRKVHSSFVPLQLWANPLPLPPCPSRYLLFLPPYLDIATSGPGPTHGATSAAQRLFRVKLVTEEDVAVGRYSIFDVVLPLPGTEVQYPQHETGAWIREVWGGWGS